MVDRNLLREFDVSDDELTALVTAEDGTNELDHFLGAGQSFEIGRIVSGKVVEVVGDQVVVDVGYKSEGLVPLNEWEDEPPPAAGRRRRGSAGRHGRRDRRDRPLAQEGAPDAQRGRWSSPATTKGTSSKARSRARSRAACWSISASTSSCRPARSISAGRPTSPITSIKRSSA